jgi:hypothetical protein
VSGTPWKNLRFKIGLALLVVNIPFGWACAAGAVALTATTGNKRWLVIGTIAYALSWGMLGLGAVLAGSEGMQFARSLRERWLRRRR